MKNYIYICACTLLLTLKCHTYKEYERSMDKPVFTEDDRQFEGVFSALDGIWVGEFHIYEDPEGQQKLLEKEPRLLAPDQIKNLNLTNFIQVRQEYHSETPFFQTVTITDSYFEHGDTIKINSIGVNKVEDGAMWCVVQKPDEQIVHRGIWQKPNTIVWSRFEKDPLKREYFKETVEENNYQIVGYGYYGSDDPTLSPKTWFLGNYSRISDFIR